MQNYNDDQQVALEYLVEDLSAVSGVEWSLEWATDGSSCILRNADSYEKWSQPATIEGIVKDLIGESKTVCTECDGSTDDGEGYEGLCGNCADKAEA